MNSDKTFRILFLVVGVLLIVGGGVYNWFVYESTSYNPIAVLATIIIGVPMVIVVIYDSRFRR
jgi:hypothetical protein